MSAGKGDTPRKVNKNKYDKNFDEIDWSKHKKPKDTKVKTNAK
jgi:hypothetical protein